MDTKELIKKIEDYKDNVFLFDWLTITSKIHDVSSLIDLLGMTPDMFTPADTGRYGYGQRTFCGGISIMSAGFSETMGVCLEMSGQGCRDFETMGNGDYFNLFRLVLENEDQMNITRLDVAYDIHDSSLDFDSMISDTIDGNWVSYWNKWKYEVSDEGQSILIGKRSSEIYLRVYDKAAERGIPDMDWKRIEMVLKRDRAFNFIQVLCDNSSEDPERDEVSHVINSVFWGVLNHYIRFIVPNPADSNKSRWQMSGWWMKLLQSLQRTSIFVRPGIQYNLHQTERYVYDQAGNSALTLIMCCGFDAFIDGLIHRKPKFSPKYRNLAAIYGCDDNLDISVEKLNQLSEVIASYKREYNLKRDRWIECEGSTPFDEDDKEVLSDTPLPSFEQMVLEGYRI